MQFASGFDVGMSDHNFCATELKCTPAWEEYNYYSFLDLTDNIRQ